MLDAGMEIEPKGKAGRKEVNRVEKRKRKDY